MRSNCGGKTAQPTASTSCRRCCPRGFPSSSIRLSRSYSDAAYFVPSTKAKPCAKTTDSLVPAMPTERVRRWKALPEGRAEPRRHAARANPAEALERRRLVAFQPSCRWAHLRDGLDHAHLRAYVGAGHPV